PDAESFVGRQVPRNVLELVRAGGSRTFETVNHAGVPSNYALSDPGRNGLRVGGLSPTTSITAKSRQEFDASAIAVAGVALAGLLAALYAARRVSAPLRSLGLSARALADGDEGARADETLPGEFRDLAVEFNHMLDAKKAADASRLARAEAEAAS